MTAARIVASSLDPAGVLAGVSGSDRGGCVLFVGTVRNSHQGRSVTALEYTAYESMAEREMAAILGEAEARFSTRVDAVHRTGLLQVGDIAIVVAAAHAHRDAAFEACRWALDQIKSRVPIWKHEFYADGSSEWVAQCGNSTGPEAPDVAAVPEGGREC